MENRRPPVGIDNFTDLMTQNFYYIDKTGMIKELLDNWGKVNLFTRPRRFGKSLNMSMLKTFFEIGTDKSIFDGLDISRETSLCKEYMGQFPVISITLKQVKGQDYDSARLQMWNLIKSEAERFDYLQDSAELNARDKLNMMNLSEGIGNLEASLYLMSRLLYKHHGKKVIILIDEYDVPLQKAESNGYYKEMAELISQIFGYGMKSNDYMLFSVVTGCLRVAKESIFTGFNNPKVHTIVDEQYDEWFGFTDTEVRQMLDYYGLSEYYDLTKEWYDGYRFGSVNVYCPWDVINWCEQLRRSQDRTPQNFWANTSSNDMVLRFVEMADDTTRADLEDLSEGKTIDKFLQMELTYADIDRDIENLWSVLFTTGYLTYRGRNEDGSWQLAIPNREIHDLFDRQIKTWFFTHIEGGMEPLYKAFDSQNIEEIEKCINACMADSISFMDGGNTDDVKETFYHGLLLGILRARRGWRVKSNREAGHGRADIILTDRVRQCGHIIEVKYARTFQSLENRAQEGLRQIYDTGYDDYFSDLDIQTIYHYGIAFHQKKCKVVDTVQPAANS
ncbi:MAG: ATP-binding protein [Clostridiales bacterium]|nr:ATP-binding protein [Clostridiales bacterium]